MRKTLALCLMLSGPALALDLVHVPAHTAITAQTDDTPAPAPTSAPTVDPDDTVGLLVMFFEAVDEGAWLTVVPVAVLLLVLAMRKWVIPRLGGRHPFLLDKRVPIVLAVLLGAATSFLGVVATGTPITWYVVFSILMSGVMAIGKFSLTKNWAEGAREAAAAAIPSKSAAAAYFKGGSQE